MLTRRWAFFIPPETNVDQKGRSKSLEENWDAIIRREMVQKGHNTVCPCFNQCFLVGFIFWQYWGLKLSPYT
jgi:hypothetical protein